MGYSDARMESRDILLKYLCGGNINKMTNEERNISRAKGNRMLYRRLENIYRYL